jgi:hypothetical protein
MLHNSAIEADEALGRCAPSGLRSLTPVVMLTTNRRPIAPAPMAILRSCPQYQDSELERGWVWSSGLSIFAPNLIHQSRGVGYDPPCVLSRCGAVRVCGLTAYVRNGIDVA